MPEQMCGVTDRCPVRAFTPKAQRTLDKMCRVMDTNPIINIVTSAVYLRHPELFYPVGLRGSLREERYTGAISVKYCTPSLTFMFQKHQDFLKRLTHTTWEYCIFFPHVWWYRITWYVICLYAQKYVYTGLGFSTILARILCYTFDPSSSRDDLPLQFPNSSVTRRGHQKVTMSSKYFQPKLECEHFTECQWR